MSKEIKKCPFCGNPGEIDKWDMLPWENLNIPNNDGYWYVVSCMDCCAAGPQEITEKEAIESWNKRVE